MVLLTNAMQTSSYPLDRLQDRTEVELARLPVVLDRGLGVEAFHATHCLGHRPKAQLGQ